MRNTSPARGDGDDGDADLAARMNNLQARNHLLRGRPWMRALLLVALLVGLYAFPPAAAADCRANFGGAYTAPHEGFKPEPDGNFFSTVAFFTFNRNGTFNVSAIIDEPNVRVFPAIGSSTWWWVGPCDIAIDRAPFVGRVSSDGRFINLATFDAESLAGTAVRDASPADAAILQPAGGNPLGPQNVFSQTLFGRLFADVLADQFAGRTSALRSGATGFSAASARFDLGRGNLGSLPQTAAAGQLAASDGGPGLSTADSGLGGFISGQFAFGSRNFTPSETGRPFTAGGVTLGVDYRIDPLAAIGLAGSYFTGDGSASGGSTNARGGALSLYGTTLAGPLYLDGFGGGGFIGYDTTRSLSIGGFSPMMSGAPSAHFIAFGGDSGYRFEQPTEDGVLRWGPVGEVRFNNVAIGGYSETGAASLSSRVRGRDATSAQSGLGAEAALDMPTALGLFTPHLRVTWRHEFADATETAIANFVVAPDLPYPLTSSRLGRDFAHVTAGISGQLDSSVHLSADYAGEVGRSNETVHQVSLAVRIAF
jgi:uncharacterized protein YhjY with autotransporter beta-barrel domain